VFSQIRCFDFFVAQLAENQSRPSSVLTCPMSSIDFWAEGSREGYVCIGDKKPRRQLMDRSSGKETTKMISRGDESRRHSGGGAVVVDPD
jgi:hypothetical protein